MKISEYLHYMHQGRPVAIGRFKPAKGQVFTDYEEAEAYINDLTSSEDCKAVYMSLHRLKDAAVSGKSWKPRTDDISGYNYLFIDFDPIRPPDTNSTDDEKEAAKKKAQEVIKAEGIRPYAIIDSGNGYHVYARFEGELAEYLNYLDRTYTDETVKIDKSVKDLARITKVPGTLTRKGPHTEDRPQRMSKVIKTDLHAPVFVIPDETTHSVSANIALLTGRCEAEGYILTPKRPTGPYAAMWDIYPCPTKPNQDDPHDDTGSAVFINHDGFFGFRCHHNRCEGHTWSDVCGALGMGRNYAHKKKKPKSADFRAAFTDLGFEFSMNDLNDQLMMNQQPLTDTMLAKVLNKMRDKGFRNKADVINEMTEAAGDSRYHPVRNWFDGLKWDGEDHFRKLLKFIKFVPGDDEDMGPIYLQKFMVGVIRKVYEGIDHPAMVWGGAQNIGKSSFTRWLTPIGPEYRIEEYLRAGEKDTKMKLATKVIWELNEIQATTKKNERSGLKAVLTDQIVTFRPPYGKAVVVKPILASFFGTFNDDGSGWLDDPTSNRRYHVVEVQQIISQEKGTTVAEVGYESIDQVQLWAQALTLYRAGYDVTLSPGDIIRRDRLNGRYKLVNVLHDHLDELLHLDERYGMKLKDMMKVLNLSAAGQRWELQKALLDWLTEHGIKREKQVRTGTGRTRLYVGVRINDTVVTESMLPLSVFRKEKGHNSPWRPMPLSMNGNDWDDYDRWKKS